MTDGGENKREREIKTSGREKKYESERDKTKRGRKQRREG